MMFRDDLYQANRRIENLERELLAARADRDRLARSVVEPVAVPNRRESFVLIIMGRSRRPGRAATLVQVRRRVATRAAGSGTDRPTCRDRVRPRRRDARAEDCSANRKTRVLRNALGSLE